MVWPQAILLSQEVDSIIQFKPIEIIENRWNIFGAGTKTQHLNKETIYKVPNQNLGELLTQNSHIFIKSYGMGSLATTSFRGGSASHTAILWNGINISSPFNALIDLSLIPASFMNDISIDYGGSGGLWGSGAVGGAIHLKNNHQVNQGFSAEMATSVGSFGQFSISSKAQFSGKKSSHQIGVLHQTAENDFQYYNPFSKNEETLQNAKLSNASVFSSNEFYLNSKNRLTFSIWAQTTNREIPPTVIEKTSKANQFDESLKLSTQYVRTLNRNLKLFIRGGYIKEYLEFNDSLRSIYSYNTANKLVGETELIYEKNNHALNFGLNSSYADALGENYTARGNQKNIAAYAGYRFKSNNQKLNISVNLRQAQQNGVGVPITYFVGGDYFIFNWLKVYGNLARVYRLPAMNDLYWIPGGNPNLKAEDGLTEEIGLSIELPNIFNAISLKHKSSIFNRNMQNWIIWTPQGSVWSPQNLLEVWSRGAETSTHISYRKNKWQAKVGLNTSYVLSTNQKTNSNKDASLGKQLLYVPMYSANLNAAVFFNRIYLSYQHQYFGYRYTTTDNTQYLNPYHFSVLGAGYSFGVKRIKIETSFTINNLFNSDYQVVLNRPMPLRNYQIHLIIKYRKP